MAFGQQAASSYPPFKSREDVVEAHEMFEAALHTFSVPAPQQNRSAAF
jgi:hypothetical protein